MATLWYATNYMPLFQSQDDGVYRRTVIIPFRAKFYTNRDCPKEGKLKDPKLKAKLMKEIEGVFRWCVDGAVAYAKEGLSVPERLYAVRDAKKDEFNPISDFARLCLDFGPENLEAAGALYRAYERFVDVNEGQKLTNTAFGRRLNGMGIVKDDERSKRMVYRRGACLNDVGKAYFTGTRGMSELDRLDREEPLLSDRKHLRAI
jgi:phage/plasmid-associated DNA primase